MNGENISFETFFEDIANLYKECYFSYMLINPGHYEEFKKAQVNFCKNTCDRINDQYADHIEGISKEWQRARESC